MLRAIGSAVHAFLLHRYLYCLFPLRRLSYRDGISILVAVCFELLRGVGGIGDDQQSMVDGAGVWHGVSVW